MGAAAPAGVGAGSLPPPETQLAAALVGNVERVIRGRPAVVRGVLATVLAGGHVLIEDVPGVGKTTLAKAVARSLGGSFARISGTADTLPGDVTGVSVWRPDSASFSFVPGPIFANVVLVDELNRIPPRSQSAFMEAMDESQVTVDGQAHPLPSPFLLLATQNPVEHAGTYPVPEGQLDRFAIKIGFGRNDAATERRVVREQLGGATVDALTAVCAPSDVLALREAARRVHVADRLVDYAVALVEATRSHPAVSLGASTRAGLTLIRCAQAWALLHGRPHVVPDDVRGFALAVLAHRLLLAPGVPAQQSRSVVGDVLGSVAVPAP